MRRGWPIGGRTMTPARLSNVILWLEADVGVTTVSGGVSHWADQSGHGRHATQATASARPTVNATGIGGKPALVFDGSNDFLATPDMLPWTGNAPMTLFVVYQPSSAAAGYPFYAGNYGANGEAWAIISNAVGTGLGDPELRSWGVLIVSPYNKSVGTPLLVEASYDGATARLAKNALAYQSTVPSFAPLAMRGDLPATIGCRPPGTGFFGGRIAAIVAMSSQARSDEVARARAYLMSKWVTP